MTEFEANNNNSAFIRLSPFFTSRGLYPCMSFDIVNLSDSITRKQLNQ